jgi:HEAT repeat protein
MAGTKLPQTEVDNRIQECYDLRFNSNDGLTHKKWIEYCHKNYGDKSEIQYSNYYAKASEMYKDTWREKLNKQLDPAVNTLIELLSSDDEKIRSRAIDQVMKYTGHDIQQIEAKIEGNIELSWGNED